MANNNYTWNSDFRVLAMHENSSEYSDGPRRGQGAYSLNYVKSNQNQSFPTWITDNLFIGIYAFGIVTNTVLLAYIIYYKRYKTPVFCIILSLGIADLGDCVGSVLYYRIVSPFIQGPLWLCHVTILLTNLSSLSSTYHIAVFAVLRFLQLVYPLTSHAKVTTGRMLKICVTIWTINSIQMAAYLFYNEPRKISTTGTSDLYTCSFTGNHKARFFWIIIFWVLVPFITMSGLHVAKHVMLALSRSVSTVRSSDERGQHVRRQTDTRALAAVIALYLLTVFPYLVQGFRIYVIDVTDNPLEVYVAKVFFQVAYSNSAINPWLYLFAAESVRSEIRKMLTCNRKI